MLAVMGIACITSLSGLGARSQIRGFSMGLLGLLLSTIGQERQSGSLRFDMGMMYLWDGLDLVPVLVGIFAIPEIIDLAVRGTAIAGEKQPGNLQAGVMEGIRHNLSPLLAGRALFGYRCFHRNLAGSRRWRRSMGRLRACRPECQGYEGPGALRQRGYSRGTGSGSGEQFKGRRGTHSDRRLRSAGGRGDGNPARRLSDYGSHTRPRHVRRSISQ